MRAGRIATAASAGLLGLALGAAAQTGAALLLYTTAGLLSSAGLLVGVVLAGVAAGLWAGRPASGRAGLRWALCVLAFALAAVFATIWTGSPGLRAAAAGRGAAVLLLLAHPAYASGSLLAALGRAGRGRVGAELAIGVLAGGAVGVVLAASTLIPHFSPGTVLLGCGVAASAGAALHAWHAPRGPAREGTEMQGKVVLITGVGNKGQMGWALAEAFLAEGARVVVTGRGDGVEAAARELSARGEVLGVAADLTRPEQVDTVLEAVRARYGRLDVVVNAAGGLRVMKPLAETTPEEWDDEVDRNARTAFLVSRAALPLLRESRGAIINFASPAGERAVARLGAYSAGKASVIALTRAMALEERRHGVRVNAVAPGMIDTEENRRSVEDPTKVKWVTREEVARVVLFLAGDASSGISGETIRVLGEGLS
ncbi:MAG TPA: SDR family NAD(P)-dependent oxidoreductase [Longimicrobiales bacterium]